MLAVVAVPTHFLTAPMFHSFPHCQSPVTAISLESLGEILLPLWLADFTAADFGLLLCVCVCVCGMPICSVGYYSLIRIKAQFGGKKTVSFSRPKGLVHWCVPLSSICFRSTASQSGAGGRVYQQHLIQEDPGPAEGEGDLGCQLWEGGGISHQWTVKETHASELEQYPFLPLWLWLFITGTVEPDSRLVFGSV